MPYWYFTSYARIDRDTYMEKFFADLREAVRVRVGEPAEDISFIDTESIEPGEEWDPKIGEALKSSRICVALCSQSYINSTYCGKEYKVFLDRHEALPRVKSVQHPRLIFPVLWVRPHTEFPTVVSRFQYDHDDFPRVYAEEGLQYIMRLRSHEDDYTKFVVHLAHKIVDAANGIAGSDSQILHPLKELPSAFHADSAALSPNYTPSRGPDTVRFAFVVARRAELEGHRSSLQAYHEEHGWFWRPYHPDVDAYVGQIAQEITSKLKLRYRELEVGTDLVDKIRALEDANEMVVVVTDAWTIRLQGYADSLKRYDRETLVNSAVLVPWNDSDPETSQHHDSLKYALVGVFPRKTQLCPPGHHWYTIRSEKDLRDKLEITLADVQATILNVLKAKRKAESEHFQTVALEQGIRVEAKPHLTGPGGHSR